SLLVKTFATWSPIGTCVVTISSLSNFNEVFVNLNVFCPIVLDWIMGNTYTLIAELLSQNNFIGPSYFTLRSSRIIFIQNPSHIPCTMARNSAFALDRATTFCFLLLQVTRFSPRNIQYPEIEYILPLVDKDTLFGICNLNLK
ncbi:hypothetical protein CR513_51733, partial [Mucuna pruriens]